MRTLQIKTTKAVYLLDVPDDWKISFSHVNPAAGSDGFRASGGYCLRISESATKQRAVFTGVLSFYDLALNLRKQRDPSQLADSDPVVVTREDVFEEGELE